MSGQIGTKEEFLNLKEELELRLIEQENQLNSLKNKCDKLKINSDYTMKIKIAYVKKTMKMIEVTRILSPWIQRLK